MKLALGMAVLSVGLACCTLASVDDEGMHVDVGIAAAPLASTSFTTDLGYEVTLTRGYVAIASVEIRPCGEPAEEAALSGRGLLRSIASPIGRFLNIREAAAHSTTSPTVLGVPGVVPLVPDAEVDAGLGELLPPPDRYCTTRIKLGPADRDAVMLPESAMIGLTLIVEGTWVGPDGGEPVPLAWESSATPSFDHDTSFELSEDGAHTVHEALTAPVATIFDGIDLATIDPAIGADRVAARVAEDLHIELR